MRIAPDGRPYDIDNIGQDPADDEVEVIQFVRPNGQRRYMTTKLDPDSVKASKDMVLSAEELRTGVLVLYGRKKDQDEDDEVSLTATNEPGPNNPQDVLRKIIKRVAEST